MTPIADYTTTSTDGPAAAKCSHGSWVRTFAGVVLAVWFTFTAFGLVVPVIPRLVTEHLHGSTTMVGSVFATAAVVALLLRPFAGQLAQRFGTRSVMALGATLAAATGGAYALPLGAPGLLAARMAMGVAEALLMTAGAVWAVSLAPPARRGQVVGLYGLSMWGGLAAGPVLGELAFLLGSYALVWSLAAALPGAALLVLAHLPRGELLGQRVSRRLLPPAAVLPGLALAAGAFGFASVTSFGALAMTDRGIAGGSMLLSLFSAAYVIVRLLASRLPDRFGPTPMIVASAGLEASGLLLIALATNWWVAAVGAVIAGGGFTLLYPSLALIAIDNAPEEERGATLGAVSSFLDLSVGVAGLVGGVVAGASYALLFGLSGALALTAIAAGNAATRRGRVRTSSRSASGAGSMRPAPAAGRR
jgi:MFS family permease